MVDNDRGAATARFTQSAVEVSLTLFESLKPEDRHELKEMLDEFLECEDAHERAEVALSIVELIAPEGYFRLEDSVDVDAWVSSDEVTRAAMDNLREKKTLFSGVVRKLIAKHGMTQAQLAEKLEVTQPTVAALVSGQHKPQPKTLKRLADALGVQPEELWPAK